MTTYFQEAEEKNFMELSGNTDFQKDLVRFFSSSRYAMTPEEMEELGPEGLAERFVTHMRWQETNEYTAMQDFSYVRDTEDRTDRELEAFGNLITAWDITGGGGTGRVDGAIDYISAFVSSPSTLATVATAGWGVGSKLAARAAGKSVQAAIRAQIAEQVQRGVANRAIQDSVAGTVRGGIVRGGLTSAAVEGAVGGVHGGMLGEIRETTTGRVYETSDLLEDVAISSVLGGTVGAAARAMDVRTQRRVVEEFASRESAAMLARQAAREAANSRIGSTTPEVASDAANRIIETVNILAAREEGVRLDPLDEKLVTRGNELRQELLGNTPTDRFLDYAPSLSIDTLRGVTAATLDIVDRLEIQPGERITAAVSRALRETDEAGNPRLAVDELEAIRDKYNLSREEMSYIYLSDLSRAGRELAEASIIERAVRRSTNATRTPEVADRNFRDAASEIGALAENRLSTFGERRAAEIVGDIYDKDNAGAAIMRGLREVDSFRIAFMVSQLGTTAANLSASTYNLVVDVSDQFWKNFAYATVGREVGGQVQRGWLGGELSTLRGLSLNKPQARIARGLFEEAFPLEYQTLFFETGRAEAALESQSGLARVARVVNTANSAIDSVFKEGAFYAGLDRRIALAGNPQFGTNFAEFLATGRSLDSLPEGIVQGAIDDARRFTFQRSFRDDPSAFGQAATGLENLHRNVPFLVSSGLGVPFPRYLANHLEYIVDYTPIVGIAANGLNRYGVKLFSEQNKTGADVFARQMTGVSAFLMGYGVAASFEGESLYDALETQTAEVDLSRAGGPWLMHMFLGDLAWRYRNDQPFPQGGAFKEMMEIALGMGDLGLDTSALAAIKDSVDEGEFTPAFQRLLGDVAATFTYPLTVFRDIQGAIDPATAPTPYTRDIFRGDPDQPSMAGEAEGLQTLNYLDELQIRASRMLPDWNILQYTQTFNGRNDIPLYSPFSGGVPVGSFNPVSRQLGFASRPRPNEIQREMNRLNIREFDLYNSRRNVPNPAVAWIVEARLSERLNEDFQIYRQNFRHEGIYEGRTYDEIEDPNLRRLLFTQFVTGQIRREVDETEYLLNQLEVTEPRRVSGYIRHMYDLKEVELARRGGDDIYDKGVQRFSEDFSSAAEFLASASTVEEELAFRREIMSWAEMLAVPAEQIE